VTESGKITASHLSRTVIYVRQSTLIQMERNTESTARQYDLVHRARQLGWPREAIRVIDGDLGISGSVTGQRDGFEGMVAEVALGQVGIIVALEVSRLARDNAAWYRLLDLAGVCDTLVADGDGVYHPALFNDRLVLGMKGIMSEAELHVLRARLEGGVRNKAARGELRRGLPVGLLWGEADGEICFHPDEAVTGADQQPQSAAEVLPHGPVAVRDPAGILQPPLSDVAPVLARRGPAADLPPVLPDRTRLRLQPVQHAEYPSPLAQAWKQLTTQLDQFVGHGMAPARNAKT
jgi:DNA invertase Pin-like site-specific DNA recombinase